MSHTFYDNCTPAEERADIAATLTIARDYLAQYVAYSESMRAIGREYAPSGEFSTDYLDGLLSATIARLS